MLIDPYHVGEIAHAINILLDDEDLKKTLIKNGFKRSKMFNWRKTAYETLKVYKEVYNY